MHHAPDVVTADWVIVAFVLALLAIAGVLVGYLLQRSGSFADYRRWAGPLAAIVGVVLLVFQIYFLRGESNTPGSVQIAKRIDPLPFDVLVDGEAAVPPTIPLGDSSGDRSTHPIEPESNTAEASEFDHIEGAPEWVSASPRLEDGTYRITVRSGVFDTRELCDWALEAKMKKVADTYVDRYLEFGAADAVDLNLPYIKEHVQKQEFTQTVGERQQVYALLEFGDAVRAEIARRWRNARVAARLWRVGATVTMVLALVGALFAYLKLDLLTGGTQRGRLQLATGAAILVVAAGAALALH